MASMVFPISSSLKKWPEPTKETASPLKGEGGGRVGGQSLRCRGPDNEIMETTP